jgi:hypothetical protein
MRIFPDGLIPGHHLLDPTMPLHDATVVGAWLDAALEYGCPPWVPRHLWAWRHHQQLHPLLLIGEN